MSWKDIVATWIAIAIIAGIFALCAWLFQSTPKAVREVIGIVCAVGVLLPVMTALFWPYGMVLRAAYEDWRGK